MLGFTFREVSLPDKESHRLCRSLPLQALQEDRGSRIPGSVRL